MEQSPNNTYLAIALLEQYLFPWECNALSKHELQIFPLFWKYATVSKVSNLSSGWPEGSFFNSYYSVGEGATPFPGLLHFTLDPYLIMLSVKQGGIKYHFLSLWYDSTWVASLK